MADQGLVLDQICIEQGNRQLVELSAQIAPGETLTLMGPSGIGKSTILAALTGTLSPAFHFTGRVILDGQDITHLPTEDRHIGILFQDELLFPHLSVGGNLAFGLSKNTPDRQVQIDQALAEIGLEGFAPRDPATLSGGQKARVALMRMLLSRPKALLLDEPFSRLDATLRAQIRDLVFTQARNRGLPVLLVTHDAEDASAAQGQIINLG